MGNMEKKQTGRFNLTEYLTGGVERLIREGIRASIHNPKESLFLGRYALEAKRASKLRRKADERGEHVPPFLIASITTTCNLHCKGCYARANHACVDQAVSGQLSATDWEKVFQEAEEMGISFILLAGGEPLVRRDVMEEAAGHPKVLFPVFTNGTMLTGEYLDLFDQKRNLIPVLSLEGGKGETDGRRGIGTYEKLLSTLGELKKRGILCGASITVTKENKEQVMDASFLSDLSKKGVKAVIYVEYVPVSQETEKLALDDGDRAYMQERLAVLRGGELAASSREEEAQMIFVSFPGDEKESGGCLAAGRGFFHINARGGAEPCPFSPYSDISLPEHSLKEALQSPLFQRLNQGGYLTEEHTGGCTLFFQKDKVEELLNG